MKKFYALLLCALMLMSSVAFATEYPANVVLDGTLPIVTEGEFNYTFEIINTTPESRVIEANEIDQAVKMKEATGIDLNWTGIPEAGFAEKINLMLASGDLPDMIWKGVDASVISQYLDQDLFTPTEKLIAEYAPNLQAILNAKPEYKALATYPPMVICTAFPILRKCLA
ncbi:MAG: extracellular solute-binding protein [Patescibacteria group bacterium]